MDPLSNTLLTRLLIINTYRFFYIYTCCNMLQQVTKIIIQIERVHVTSQKLENMPVLLSLHVYTARGRGGQHNHVKPFVYSVKLDNKFGYRFRGVYFQSTHKCLLACVDTLLEYLSIVQFFKRTLTSKKWLKKSKCSL